MRHVKAVDGQRHTVIMIQVENEIGVPDSRDRSPAAVTAFEGPVPQDLMDYLQKHKDIADSRVAQGVGGGRTEDLRDLARGLRPAAA